MSDKRQSKLVVLDDVTIVEFQSASDYFHATDALLESAMHHATSDPADPAPLAAVLTAVARVSLPPELRDRDDVAAVVSETMFAFAEHVVRSIVKEGVPTWRALSAAFQTAASIMGGLTHAAQAVSSSSDESDDRTIN